ncbi:MAG: B12-binding domain-containing radical SAM protein [Planctomycetota bacterium]|jgi:radical SAM superfamily enzyme YgiQ (UPF0313 family)
MKILLIYPPITEEEVYAQYSGAAPCLPPLGLCYLARYLLDANYDVKIIDCVAERLGLQELRSRIVEYSPTVVGVSSTTVAFYYATQVLSLVKDINPEIVTVLGGAHLTAFHKESMGECESIDIGVLGEGEQTLLDIVGAIENGDSIDTVQGIVHRQDGNLIQTESRPTVMDLDEIPFPARELLPGLDTYVHTALRGKKKKLTTTMITSRGCPKKCAYCDQSVFGRVWRSHSAEYVFSEMKSLKEGFGVDFISFEDDNFSLSRERVKALCKMIIEYPLDIGWACSGRADNVDEEMLKLMKKAGCESIYVGIESGSPRILKLLNKNISKEKVIEGIRKIKRSGMRVLGSFILGIPSETKEEMAQTLDYALTLPLDGVSFFIFTPYPRTELRDLAFQYGKVSTSWKDYTGHPSGTLPYVPNDITQDELLAFQEKAYKRFLLRPSYVLRYLKNHSMWDLCTKGILFLKAFYLKKNESERRSV